MAEMALLTEYCEAKRDSMIEIIHCRCAVAVSLKVNADPCKSSCLCNQFITCLLNLNAHHIHMHLKKPMGDL